MVITTKNYWANLRPGQSLDLPDKLANALIERGVARPATIGEATVVALERRDVRHGATTARRLRPRRHRDAQGGRNANPDAVPDHRPQNPFGGYAMKLKLTRPASVAQYGYVAAGRMVEVNHGDAVVLILDGAQPLDADSRALAAGLPIPAPPDGPRSSLASYDPGAMAAAIQRGTGPSAETLAIHRVEAVLQQLIALVRTALPPGPAAESAAESLTETPTRS